MGFGENRIASLIQQHPEKKPEVQEMQKQMSHYMLAASADRFREMASTDELGRARDISLEEREQVEWKGVNISEAPPEDLQAVLSDTVLSEFKTRLTRLGIEYQTPD
ncbi:MAG: hypothetical protein QF570_12605 [Myxococcota bacterium]|nr:hypothetical protein [Myxococcota bacterium]